MDITYISHAGYLVESRTGKTRLLLDPWFDGSTYMDQCWLAWSYPGLLEDLVSPHGLLFTHYHKDHFHPSSARRVSRKAEAVVPTTPGSFFREKVAELGFAEVREISAGEPLRLGEFEIHSIRIADHWEFLDETAYLIVEGKHAALFLADLWYLPEALLRRACGGFQISFAALTWGAGMLDLYVLPKGFRLGSFEEYYRYGFDDKTLAEKNAVNEYDAYLHLASLVEAEHLVPGSLSFGWISPEENRVKPLPICGWLNQEQFIDGLPDPRLRAKSHAMYPGDRFSSEEGFKRRPGSALPNTPVTDAMRRLCAARRDASLKLDGKDIAERFLAKIATRLGQLKDSRQRYEERLGCILSASRLIELQIVNEARQVFLFEQEGERFRMREVSGPTGAPDILYVPPSVVTSLVTDWGPCWTEAEESSLVKVSATGWDPYLIMRQLFC